MTDCAPSNPAHHAHGAHGRDHGSGRDRHAGHSVQVFRDKFWATLLLSVPTIVWAPMIQHWFGYQAPGGPVTSRWVPAVFGTLVFGYGGLVFLRGAVGEIRDRETADIAIRASLTGHFVYSTLHTNDAPSAITRLTRSNCRSKNHRARTRKCSSGSRSSRGLL